MAGQSPARHLAALAATEPSSRPPEHILAICIQKLIRENEKSPRTEHTASFTLMIDNSTRKESEL